MRKIKYLSGFILLCIILILTSAVPVKNRTSNPISIEQKVTKMLTEANSGVDISPKELIKVAEQIKGEKLTFKEKLALKLFNKKLSNGSEQAGKSQLIALILVLLVGGLGIHRFYLGYTWQGVVQLLTGGGCGIWALIDLVRIITGNLQPKDGPYGTTL
jgi:hypothetical protein